MNSNERTLILVGDNPFHGISHLSQERSRIRDKRIRTVDFASDLVRISSENGANGFMFSVSETTLSIIASLRKNGVVKNLELLPIVPYAYEYVRLATQTGGVPGLAKRIGREIVFSGNVRAIAMGVKGLASADINSILKMYLLYEMSRIKSAAGKNSHMRCVLLHEILTEVCLALDLDWLFRAYIDFMIKMRLNPGFETRNFAFLVRKFNEWGIDFSNCIIATPFNKAGFQMNPSRTDCEAALERVGKPRVIAMSVLAAGYHKPAEAIEYLRHLPNIKGVVVGVSKESQARETFRLFNNLER